MSKFGLIHYLYTPTTELLVLTCILPPQSFWSLSVTTAHLVGRLERYHLHDLRRPRKQPFPSHSPSQLFVGLAPSNRQHAKLGFGRPFTVHADVRREDYFQQAPKAGDKYRGDNTSPACNARDFHNCDRIFSAKLNREATALLLTLHSTRAVVVSKRGEDHGGKVGKLPDLKDNVRICRQAAEHHLVSADKCAILF